MDISEDGNTLVSYGGYHQDGNKMYLLSNLKEIGNDDWEEDWKESTSTEGSLYNFLMLVQLAFQQEAGAPTLLSSKVCTYISSKKTDKMRIKIVHSWWLWGQRV